MIELPERVAGLDLSITETGLVCTDGGEPQMGESGHREYLITTKRAGDLRLTEIDDVVHEAMIRHRIQYALLEDLPTHAHAAGITGKVHGVVRARLIRLGIPYGSIPPSNLKQYATGKGSGPGTNKAGMILQAFKRGGIEFKNDNLCDAWWLWSMANDKFHIPNLAMPAPNRKAIDKIKTEVSA